MNEVNEKPSPEIIYTKTMNHFLEAHFDDYLKDMQKEYGNELSTLHTKHEEFRKKYLDNSCDNTKASLAFFVPQVILCDSISELQNLVDSLSSTIPEATIKLNVLSMVGHMPGKVLGMMTEIVGLDNMLGGGTEKSYDEASHVNYREDMILFRKALAKIDSETMLDSESITNTQPSIDNTNFVEFRKEYKELADIFENCVSMNALLLRMNRNYFKSEEVKTFVTSFYERIVNGATELAQIGAGRVMGLNLDDLKTGKSEDLDEAICEGLDLGNCETKGSA